MLSVSRFLTKSALFALTAQAGVVWSGTALACGGLFCSASSPVNQVAERIIFAQDAGTTTQIVEIRYEGPSNQFAWVLPVPGAPEVGLGSSVAFDRLQQATNPQYNLTTTMEDGCGGGVLGGIGSADTASPGSAENAGPRVSVVDQGSVGPYDYQTISVAPADADPADVAIRWLQTNGYDVGAIGPDVLRPYLESGLNLLAVRLQKGLPTGAIRPISLTFTSDRPSIPIRPTAVAAAEDMGILVWLLGDSRAVPTNYKGLELNELLIDWTNAGSTYDQVVSAAADEAGGQGFVTELAMAADSLQDAIDPGFDALSAYDYPEETPLSTLQQLTYAYGAYDGFDKVLAENVVFREGVTVSMWLDCPDCYTSSPSFDFDTDPIHNTDISVVLDAVQSQVLQPITDTAELFSTHAYVTRLYTTMSADDMDMDPVFDFNPDLEDVSNIHTAERYVTCDGVSGPWRVTLADGRKIYGEGFSWPLNPGSALSLPANARVVSYKESGPAQVETNNASQITATFSELPASKPNGVEGGVFSCSIAERQARGGRELVWASLLILGAAGVGARRGRRQRAR